VQEQYSNPHQELLGGGGLTSIPLFRLICIIVSNKMYFRLVPEHAPGLRRAATERFSAQLQLGAEADTHTPYFAESFAAHKHSHLTAPTTLTHTRLILQSLLQGQPLQNSTPQTSREAPHKEPRNTGRCERTMGCLRLVGSLKL